jgi:hypothetical protein
MRRPWLWFGIAAVIVMLGGALAGAVSVITDGDAQAPATCSDPPCGSTDVSPSPSPETTVGEDVPGPCDEAEHADDPACAADEAKPDEPDEHGDEGEDHSGPGGGGSSGPG